MENLPTLFKPKQENIAKFYAYMTNSFTDKDEKGQIFLLRQSEINEIIAQMYEKKDFVHAARLFECLKELPKGQDNEVATMISKSLRLDPITYLETQKVAYRRKICLSDVIRTTSIPKMRIKLDEIKNIPTVDQEKFEIMYDLLKNWEAKVPTSPDKEYLPRYNYTVTNEIKELLSELIKYSILDECKEEGITIDEGINEFVSNGYIDWEIQEIFPEVSLSFDSQSNLFKLDVEWVRLCVIFSEYNAFKENIDVNLHKKLDNIFKCNNNCFHDEDNDCLFYYPFMPDMSIMLHIENDRLFFDGVDVVQKDALDALIYEKFTNEKYADFAVEEKMKQVQDALVRKDYNTAAQLNEKLVRFQVYSKISSWYGGIMKSMANESNVVTFTIPKLLLLLWEVAKSDKSVQKFVKDNLQEE